MTIIRILDTEGSGDYDLYVSAPEGVTVEQIDQAIRDAKAADPDEYNANDLYAILAEIGVLPIEIIDADETW